MMVGKGSHYAHVGNIMLIKLQKFYNGKVTSLTLVDSDSVTKMSGSKIIEIMEKKKGNFQLIDFKPTIF